MTDNSDRDVTHIAALLLKVGDDLKRVTRKLTRDAAFHMSKDEVEDFRSRFQNFEKLEEHPRLLKKMMETPQFEFEKAINPTLTTRIMVSQLGRYGDERDDIMMEIFDKTIEYGGDPNKLNSPKGYFRRIGRVVEMSDVSRVNTIVNHPAIDLQKKVNPCDTLLRSTMRYDVSEDVTETIMLAGYKKAREQGQDAIANHLINCADTYEAAKRKGHERGMKLLADHISEVCENHDIEVSWAGDADLLEQFEQLRSDVAEQVSSIDKNGKRSEADSNHDDSPSIG
jgi:hypothetical protein